MSHEEDCSHDWTPGNVSRNQGIIEVPDRSCTAIAEATARYAAPLWELREERVLKLGAHQSDHARPDVATAQALFAHHPAGIVATGWKLFPHDWAAAAHAYFHDAVRYPTHPPLGPGCHSPR